MGSSARRIHVGLDQGCDIYPGNRYPGNRLHPLLRLRRFERIVQKNGRGKAAPTARERLCSLVQFASQARPGCELQAAGPRHRSFGQCQFYRSITQSRLRLSLARCSTRTKVSRHNDAPLPPNISLSRSDALKRPAGRLPITTVTYRERRRGAPGRPSRSRH